MKKGIHPEYYPEAKIVCACGSTFTIGSTKELIKTDVCSACHPFFTGEQRIVDTAGQVERFMRRLERRTEMIAEEEAHLTAVEAEEEGEEADTSPGDEPVAEAAEASKEKAK